MAKPRVMQPKPKRAELTAADIQVGKVFRGKHPTASGIAGVLNDRHVIYVSPRSVQYDSSAVKLGAKYPTVSMLKFLKWASHEVF